MSSASSTKQKRREALRQWKRQQSATARNLLPADPEEMQALFDHLDTQLATAPCDHTLRLCRAWASTQSVDFAVLEKWLKDNGGYCDCEALLNAEQAFQEAIS